MELDFSLPLPWLIKKKASGQEDNRVQMDAIVSRLLWEFRDIDCLRDLLHHVGNIVRVDQNTLLRLKGKFARVCINLDITKPLPSSITITKGDMTMRVPIIYEGLHEVCLLCGGESHQLEKFDNQGLSHANRKIPVDPKPPFTFRELGYCRSQEKSLIYDQSLSSNRLIKPTSTASLDQDRNSHSPEPSTNPPHTNIEGPAVTSTHPTMICKIPNLAPTNPEGIVLANLNVVLEDPPINDETLNDIDEGMNEDKNVDVYLNLHNIEDIEMSTDSFKRKRCEDGKEAISQAN
ncbi:hypothetical protein Cgig2_007677 [Carnegiea gigantea]|uniref:Uncharacterized protein n=1 Tax=Carnegiea gigantea TaxID=171969 RepID=A0A9Q1QBY1_9CARY|nr:hypothetical protein Cgig2_007677 [Carnegiea gigantea]